MILQKQQFRSVFMQDVPQFLAAAGKQISDQQDAVFLQNAQRFPNGFHLFSGLKHRALADDEIKTSVRKRQFQHVTGHDVIRRFQVDADCVEAVFTEQPDGIAFSGAKIRRSALTWFMNAGKIEQIFCHFNAARMADCPAHLSSSTFSTERTRPMASSSGT